VTQPPCAADALLVVSFGGPEAPDEVMPFLRRVTAGRNVPDDRLEIVAEHYHVFGGKSPINGLNRTLVAALCERLQERGRDLPVYLANRNSEPWLPDVFSRIAADGHHRVAVFLTSAYSSWSGCRQYRENLAEAATASGVQLDLALLPHFSDEPGFVLPFADGLRHALGELPDGSRAVFVTHSIPAWMDGTSGTNPGTYAAQHRETARLVSAAAGVASPCPEDAVVFCSRSGPPSVPWLEPDINEHLRDLAVAGVPGAALVPIGFVSDHMEVVYDLDTEAAATAAGLGLAFRRVATPGTDPRFVALVIDLLDRVEKGQVPGHCPAGCCRNPRAERPALCGADSP
jgi:protoporphyrin/coproporphyrin ferrochelatase